MEKWLRSLKKIFCLQPLPTVLLALFGYGLVLAVGIFGIENPVPQYVSYLCSAYALMITITAIVRYWKTGRRAVAEHTLVRRLRATSVWQRFFSDVRFRTELSLYQGLLVNILYIGIKLFSGMYYRSVWFVALAAYYILLAVMRFVLLRRGKTRTDRTPMEIELRRYRMCGLVLLLTHQALAGIVAFIVYQDKGFHYPGVLIYAMAAYAFYSVIVAIVNLVKFARHGSPILSAAKVINLVAAMVSILSLETAMLAQFGGENDHVFRQIMTGATGAGVCVLVIGMAVFMIVTSTKELKAIRSTTI